MLRRICLCLLSLQFLFCAAAPAGVTDVSANYEWKQLRIGGGGFVTGVVNHPTTPGLVYCRTDVGGAYRWDEPSKTWVQLIKSPGVPAPLHPWDFFVESIAVDPSDSNVVYAAVGNYWGLPTPDRGRVLKSTNRGDSWTDTGFRAVMGGNKEGRQAGERLAVDSANSNVVYFGSRTEGLWVSNDGGSTWNQVPTSQIPVGSSAGDPVGVVPVVFDPSQGTVGGKTKRIYAGVAGGGVYVSDNAGATWNQTLGAADSVWDLEVGSDGTAWALLKGRASTVHKRSGGNWSAVTPGRRNSPDALAVDPFNPQRVIVVQSQGAVAWRTTNAGGSWTQLGAAMASEKIGWILNTNELSWFSIGDIEFSPHAPDQLWLAQGTGMWRTADVNDDRITWGFVSKGIEEMVANEMIAPAGGRVVSTCYDRAGFYHASPDAYPDRTILTSQFCSAVSIDACPTSPGFLAVVATNHHNAAERFSGYSSDGGQTWTPFASMPSNKDWGNIVVSATSPDNIVWLPTGQSAPVFSTNRGGSWSNSAGVPTGNLHEMLWWSAKRALTADTVLPGTFYVVRTPGGGGTAEAYRSTDGGASFTLVGTMPGGADAHVFGNLRAAPGQAGHVYNASDNAGFFKSTDQGGTWVKLPDVQVARAFGFGATVGGAYPAIYLYGQVGSNWGFFRSDDAGANWKKVADHAGGIYAGVKAVNGDMNLPGRLYVAFDGVGNVYGSDTTVVDTTPPAAPGALVAAAVGGTRIDLNWNDGTDLDLAGYNVYRGTSSGGPYAKRNASLLTSSDYSDTGLSAGATYHYVVRAVDTSNNESGNSNQASATTSNCLPSSTHVDAVTTAIVSCYVKATVVVKDNCGVPVAGATVTGTFSHYGETGSGVTDASGVAVIQNGKCGNKFSGQFCVTNITHNALGYDSAANVQTCQSYKK